MSRCDTVARTGAKRRRGPTRSLGLSNRAGFFPVKPGDRDKGMRRSPVRPLALPLRLPAKSMLGRGRIYKYGQTVRTAGLCACTSSYRAACE